MFLKIVSNGFKVLRETAIWSIHNQKLFNVADSSQHETDLFLFNVSKAVVHYGGKSRKENS